MEIYGLPVFFCVTYLTVFGGVSSFLLTGGSAKKGVGIGGKSLLCGDFNVYRGHVAWWYDWGLEPTYWTSGGHYSGCGALLENRAAMVWGWNTGRTVDIPAHTQMVLGYNEPNSRGQANLSPVEAASHWKAIEHAAGNRTLVGPSAILCGHPQCNETLWDWMDEFFHHCQGCRVDYMAAHLYGGNANQEMAFLDRLYHRYNKKIWVTEFAKPHVTSQQAQIDYMKEILPRFESSPFVARYAWFSSRLQ